jgi:hypothetical protein
MEPIRDVLITLTDAAESVSSAACAVQQGDADLDRLYTAIGEMQGALNEAHRVLDESHHLIIMGHWGFGNPSIYADHRCDLSCIMLNTNIASVRPNDPFLVEIEWTETKHHFKALIDYEPIQIEPRMVADAVRAKDAWRDRPFDWGSALKRDNPE